eukprot:TRINITY_DN35104_c0_g1_i1.p3 TRINITY_DN35104_c0_g1~~TRINITY_DN35104_c0_g1_i1.p3  ORF type:complete len:119 (-),score=54.64 TRINITY_DN35104_c0_g1_i1:224-580(-)
MMMLRRLRPALASRTAAVAWTRPSPLALSAAVMRMSSLARCAAVSSMQSQPQRQQQQQQQQQIGVLEAAQGNTGVDWLSEEAWNMDSVRRKRRKKIKKHKIKKRRKKWRRRVRGITTK